MKTTIKLSILAFLAAFAFSSCTKDKIKGTGSVVMQEFVIQDFNQVSNAIDAEVNYIYSINYRVEVNVPQNVIDKMQVQKSGKTLCIKFDKGTVLFSYEKIKANFYSPRFAGANLSGSGLIYTQGSFTSNNVKVDISGNGEV